VRKARACVEEKRGAGPKKCKGGKEVKRSKFFFVFWGEDPITEAKKQSAFFLLSTVMMVQREPL